MAAGTGQGPVIFTGNNMQISINGIPYGFVETLTISRGVGRRPAYAVGSNLFVDAPVTQASVTVQATNLVPINGNNALGQDAITAGGSVSGTSSAVPKTSLANEVDAPSGNISVTPLGGSTPIYHVVNAFYNQDSVTVPNTDLLTYNLSWTAQDVVAFQV